MAEKLYVAPAIQPPTLQQLTEISAKLGLDITGDELPEYSDSVRKSCEAYNQLDELLEPSLPVKYPRTAGYRPPAGENPYNAWYYKTEIKGAGTGKLKGKKLVMKDNIGMAGVPMMCGSKLFEGYVPEYDATVVTRVLDAGGTIVGKGVCEDLCRSLSSCTSQTGPVLNPYDKSRSAGGSSSGVAVLVQTGEADMAIGGDQAGSIRMPASFVGIVGLKPSFGLVPYSGICSMAYMVDHAGPMARTVRDCALLLEVVAGSDHGTDCRQPDALTVPNYSELLSQDLSGMTIGLVKEGFQHCEKDVADLVYKAAVDNFTAAGARVEDVSIPNHSQAATIAHISTSLSSYTTMLKNSGFNTDQRGYQPTSLIRHLFQAGKNGGLRNMSPILKRSYLLAEYVLENYGFQFCARARNLLPSFVRAYDDVLEKCDVLVMPTTSCIAKKLPPADAGPTAMFEHQIGLIDNTVPFNWTGHPSLSLNAGFSEGLPVGMMITGKRLDDATVLKVAYAFEQKTDSVRPITKGAIN